MAHRISRQFPGDNFNRIPAGLKIRAVAEELRCDPGALRDVSPGQRYPDAFGSIPTPPLPSKVAEIDVKLLATTVSPSRGETFLITGGFASAIKS